MPVSISLKSIQEKSTQARKELINQVQNLGFALIELDDQIRAQDLNWGIQEAKGLDGFRFPPINVERIQYTEVHRVVFKALFFTGLECLSLISGQDELKKAQVDHLFSESEHEPFPLNHDYQPTFFNLFNYNHGALNTHKDRGLITIIHIDPPRSDLKLKSTLWIAGSDQTWRSGDALILEKMILKPNSRYALMLIGEEGEQKFKLQGLDHIYAADHSVRVKPDGDYIEYSHYQRDPDSKSSSNRLSAALILQKS